MEQEKKQDNESAREEEMKKGEREADEKEQALMEKRMTTTNAAAMIANAVILLGCSVSRPVRMATSALNGSHDVFAKSTPNPLSLVHSQAGSHSAPQPAS